MSSPNEQDGQASAGVCSASDMTGADLARGTAYPSRSEELDPDTSPAKRQARERDRAFSPDSKAPGVSRDLTVDGDDFGALEAESFTLNLKSLLQGFIQQTQTTMESLLCSVSEIEESSADVDDELQNAKEIGIIRKSRLEDDRYKVHHAACRVLEVLEVPTNATDPRHPHSDADDGENRHEGFMGQTRAGDFDTETSRKNPEGMR